MIDELLEDAKRRMDKSVETVIRSNAGKMRPGDVYMLNAPYNGGTHLRRNAAPDGPAVRVPCRPLTAMLKLAGISSIDAIKIDIEGAEHLALAPFLREAPEPLLPRLVLIEDRPHSLSAVARERATLLEIGKAAFDRLFTGDDRVAARFQNAINHELLQSLARANNHLTRLISQSRIRGGRKDRKQAEELQHALATEDCRTA